MLDVKIIEDLVKPICEEKGLMLYEVLWVKENGFQVLRVSVDKPNGGIDSDTLGLVNELLSEKLDAYDDDMPEYMLEVCSPGAERTLRNKEEILASVGQYVNVKTPDSTYEGTLLSYEGQTLVVEINIKGRMKKVSIEEADIKKIRLAVKI